MKRSQAFRWAGIWLASITFAVTSVVADGNEPRLEPTEEGVRVEGNLVPGSSLIESYSAFRAAPGLMGSGDRELNRRTVLRFFELPIGADRAKLYAADGVKQLPALGIQWIGLDAQLSNNEQNRGRYPGWSWSDVTVWGTEDPSVFWVEDNGATAPGAEPAYSNHYVMQFVVRDGRIVLFREFGAPVRVTAGGAR